MQAAGTSTTRGLAVVLFAGLCFFVFSPAFNLATNDQWHLLKKGVPHLVVYTAFFYFYLSGFVIAVCVNIWLLYRPIASVPASTMEAYLRDWNGRHWALLSGLLCGFCNGFQFMGGQAAGFATADAVMVISARFQLQLCYVVWFMFWLPDDIENGLTGVATHLHHLGYHPFWWVPEVIEEDVFLAHQHADLVCRRYRGSLGFSRP